MTCAGPFGDRGHDLHRARPGADDRHPLAGDVQVGGPARGVEQRPPERVHAGERRDLRPVELPDGGDHGVGDERLACRGRDRPPLLAVDRARHLGVEPDDFAQVVGVGDVAQVGEHLVALAEVGGPAPRRERVGVEVARGVDTRAGIGVLQPGAADVGVLLQHHVVDARLGQPDRGEHSRDPGADDHDPKVRAPRRRGVRDVEAHVLGRHRPVFRRHGLTDGEVDQLQQRVPGRRRHGGQAPCRPRQHGVDGRGPDLGLDLRGEPARVVVLHAPAAGGPIRVGQVPAVAGELVEHRDERREVGVFHRVGEHRPFGHGLTARLGHRLHFIEANRR